MPPTSGLRRLIGAIQVEENQETITISGIPSYAMTQTIQRIWKTSRINNYLFTKVGRHAITFPRFFAPEVAYILGTLQESNQRGVARRTLSRILDKLQAHTWLPEPDAEYTSRFTNPSQALSKLTLKPLEFQDLFLKAYDELTQKYRLRGFLLAGSAGSGKTYTTMALAELLQAGRVIVISPKNALYRVWEANLQSNYKRPPSYYISDRNKQPDFRARYQIYHYEDLKRAIVEQQQNHRQQTLIALDESHNLNELDAERTQLFLKLCQQVNPEDVLFLSGTPIKALGAEALPILRAIDPLFTPDVEQRFRKIFGRNATKGLDIIRHRLGLVSHIIPKSDLGLADPVIQDLPVTLKNSEQFTLNAVKKEMKAFIDDRHRYYAKYRQAFETTYQKGLDHYLQQRLSAREKEAFAEYQRGINQIRKTTDYYPIRDTLVYCNNFEKKTLMPALPAALRQSFNDARSVVKYVELKVQGECLGRVLGTRREACYIAMSQALPYQRILESTEKKTIVFTSYVKALEAMEAHLPSLELQPLTVYGKTNKELNSRIQHFEKQPDINPLLATYQSLSTAVPLTMADTAIMLNPPFRNYIYEQAISRMHRLGADTTVNIYNAVLDTGSKPNLSTRGIDILAWSQKQVEAIMGIKSPFEVETASTGVETWKDGATPTYLVAPLHDLTLTLEDYRADPPSTQPIHQQWG